MASLPRLKSPPLFQIDPVMGRIGGCLWKVIRTRGWREGLFLLEQN